MYTTPAGGIPFQPGYSPAIGATTLTYWFRELLNAVGGGNVTRVEWNSDGGHFRKMLLPNGSAHTYFAEQWAMNGQSGGAAAGGSAIALQITGPAGGFGDNLELCSLRGYQDSQNYGSAQATGHWELWCSGPALASGPTMALKVTPGQTTVPVNLTVGQNEAVVGDLVVGGNVGVAGGIAAHGGLPVCEIGVASPSR